jgi:hypothetical protein
MSKPSDISQETWDTAIRAVQDLDGTTSRVLDACESIALAIMAATLAEREACAVEAESFAVTGGKLWERERDRDRAALHLAQSYGAKSVAEAIRKRGEA